MDPFPEQIDGGNRLFPQVGINRTDGLGEVDIPHDVVKAHKAETAVHSRIFHHGYDTPGFHIAEGEETGDAFLLPGLKLFQDFLLVFRLGVVNVSFRNAGTFDMYNRVVIESPAQPVKAVKIVVDGPCEGKMLSIQALKIE